LSFRSVFIAIVIAFALILGAFLVQRARPRVETDQPNVEFVKATGKCAECHSRQQYSIVHEFEMSKHATQGVTCLDCHQPQKGQEKDKIDHNGFQITAHITPANCRVCHEQIYQEFVRSRHAAPSWSAVFGEGGLTAEQVDAAKKIYAGPTNPRTGDRIYPGLEPGSEFAWSTLIAGPETFLGGDFFTYMVFQDPTWDFHTLDFDRDIALADATLAPIIDSTSSDLSGFRSRGGKLLMYHGWADPLVSPDTSLIMFKRINEAVGRAASGSLALFMVPGMGHCQGGPGTDQFDKVAAVDQWIESGTKPLSIPASHVTGGIVDRTRPLCAYPATAHYLGSGSTNDAKNFQCK